MPNALDDEGDDILTSVELHDTESFASWDSENNKIIFSLDSTITPGNYEITIVLDDGELQTEYLQEVHVIENTSPRFTEQIQSIDT